MAGLGSSSTAPSWKCDYRISATSNGTSQSGWLLTHGSYQQQTPEQGGRIDYPTSSRYHYFRPKTARWPLRLSNHYKALWVDSVEVCQVQTGLQGALLVKSSRPEDELKRLCKDGQLDRALDVLVHMDQLGVVPSVKMYTTLLKACTEGKALVHAKRVYDHLVDHGLESIRFLGEYVVNTLVKCDGLDDALEVFNRLPQRSVFSWTAIISGYTTAGRGREALRMYWWMQEQGVLPDTYTFVSVIKACSSIADLQEGKLIHAEASKYRCDSDLFVGNCLVDMYGKCGSAADAQIVFDGLSSRDVVSWNVMIAAHVEQGHGGKALYLYEQMQEEGGSPSRRTFLTVLQACGMLAGAEEDVVLDGRRTKVKSLQQGKAVHTHVRRNQYDSDIFVCSTLISVYGKCRSIADAQSVFDALSQHDVVSWNALLAAYVDQGQGEQALQVYARMQQEGVSPNDRTFVSMIQACSALSENQQNVMVEGENGEAKFLEMGKAMHGEARRKGYDSGVFVGNTLLNMYGKCGSLVDAQNVFDGLAQRNVVSCNSLIAAYVEQDLADKAWELYEKMLEEGISPQDRSFVSALQACCMLAEKEEDVMVAGQPIKLYSLLKGRTIHAEVCRKGHDSDVFVSSTLTNMYGKCGSIVDAQNVFDRLAQRDVVSSNSLLSAYTELGQAKEALQLYEQMQENGESLSNRTFVSTLEACGMLAEEELAVLADGRFIKPQSLGMGKAIHADAWRKGYDLDVFVGNTLVNMYGKCGEIEDARNMFEGLWQRDVVSWNAMIAAYVEKGQGENALQLYEQMCSENVSPLDHTFVSALQACGVLAGQEEDFLVNGRSTKARSVATVKALHADLYRKGYQSSDFVGFTLVSLYGKCGSIADAEHVFDGLCQRHLVSWNSLLTAYIEQGEAEKALQLYDEMHKEHKSPNSRTFVSALHACGMLEEKEEGALVGGLLIKLKALDKGKAIHADAQIKGYGSDVFVGKALVSMYGKCGSIADAQNSFHGLPQPDVVAWTAMLAAYVQQTQGMEALQLYEQMRDDGVSPSEHTFVTMIQACRMIAAEEMNVLVAGEVLKTEGLKTGKAIHADAQRKNCASDAFVSNTLISLYGKCGSLVDAENVFDDLSPRALVSWNVMLAAYVEQCQPEKAFQLWHQMKEKGVSADERSYVSISQACRILSEDEEGAIVDGHTIKAKSLQKAKAIHAAIHQISYDVDGFVGSTLVSMYAKCGCVAMAQHVFDELSHADAVAWSAIIVAYVEQGYAENALQLYRQMLLAGKSLDDITLVSVLQACSNTGSLYMLKQIHLTLVATRKNLSILIANTLISAYGKCASMLDAQNVFNTLREADVVSWNALISSYARQGDYAASLKCYEKMETAGVIPNGVTFVALIHACSHAGFVGKGVEYFESMLKDFDISPEIGHYVSMVDLFGRAGCFTRLEDLLVTMPVQPNLALWLCLLAACRKHGKVILGEQAFASAVRLQPKHAAAYILMANIYADAGRMDHAQKVREQGGVWKKPGQSWIQHEEQVHSFLAGDSNHPQHKQLHNLLQQASV